VARFKLITDEHWSKAHVKALKDAGWDIVRVVDVLGQKTEDPDILAYCDKEARVWVTTDQSARGHITNWLAAGKPLPGVVIGIQRHREDITPGALLRFLEKLAAEATPFASLIRYVKPEAE
jgi:uncharacterized protein DUF5615